MKKIMLSILCLAAIGLVSCSQKKDRLTSDTLTIAIDPPSVLISTGTAKTLKAICAVNGKSVVMSPAWSVESTVVPAGIFSAASGSSTTFTSGPTACSGKIYATVSNVRTHIPFTIYGSTPAGTAIIYSLYDSGVFNSDLATPGIATYSGDSMVLASDLVNHSAGQTQSFKATYTLTGSLSWATWFLSESANKDLSAYYLGYIRFDIASINDVQIGICSANINPNTNTAKKYISQYGMVFDGAFHSIAIPVSELAGAQPGTDLTQVSSVFIAAVIESEIGSPQAGQSFWIDNLRWTSN